MQAQRPNSGVLFKNDRKESERHPHYVGSINVDGIERRLSAWVKVSKSGGKFMSLSVAATVVAETPAPKLARGQVFDADEPVF